MQFEMDSEMLSVDEDGLGTSLEFIDGDLAANSPSRTGADAAKAAALAAAAKEANDAAAAAEVATESFPSPTEPAAESFAVGEAVEANYGEEGTYYKGEITKVHANGCCDILYEDGDDETEVPPRLIRSLGGGSAAPPEAAQPDAAQPAASAAPRQALGDALKQFYSVVAPRKVGNVDDLLEDFEGARAEAGATPREAKGRDLETGSSDGRC